jgi:hypothetical protein
MILEKKQQIALKRKVGYNNKCLPVGCGVYLIPIPMISRGQFFGA